MKKLLFILLGLIGLGVIVAQGPGPIPPEILYSQVGVWSANQSFNGLLTVNGGLVGNSGGGTVEPLDGTVLRAFSGVTGDTINPLFYNPGGTPVDITGATDAEPALNAALVQACATTQAKTIIVPPGKYLFNEPMYLPANCSHLTIKANDPNSVVFIAGPTNNTFPQILQWITGNDYIRIENIIFDGGVGSVAGNGTSIGLIQVFGAPRDPQFVNDTFRNATGNGIWNVAGGWNNTTPMSAEANEGDSTINFTGTLPASIKVGAFLAISEQDPDYYIQSLTSNTITFQKPLTDYLFTAEVLPFSSAFVLSATAQVGATTLSTSDTTGIAVAQTIYAGPIAATYCITSGTRILSFVTNTSVTIDKPLQCQIASGTGIAAELGIPNLLVENNTFDNLGETRFNQSTATYTTSAAVSSGTTVTFNCRSGAGCYQVGPIPGQLTMPTGNPAGMPANNLVLSQTNLNPTTGIFQLTFANAVTANIPAGTPIPFTAGALPGVGYGIWDSFGEWFGNPNHKFIRNKFSHTWSSPIFVGELLDPVITNNSFQIDRLEFQDAAISPSACGNVENIVNGMFDNNTCSGTTGDGVDFLHTINTIVRGNRFYRTGLTGINFLGGRTFQLQNNTIIDAGQNQNYAQTQLQGPFGGGYAGVQLSGSWTEGRLGLATGLIVDDLIANDDQPTATQTYGIVLANHTSSLGCSSCTPATSPVYGQLSFIGNKILPSDPALGITPLPAGEDNRIVNPCAAIDQRNAGAQAALNAYDTDQWKTVTQPYHINFQQDTTAQNGCSNSEKMTVNTQNVSPGSTDFAYLYQGMENGNLYDLDYGASLAENVIVDFCAKTSTAGTYGWGLQSHFPMPNLRAYASSYTTTGTTSQCFSFSVPGDQVAALSPTPTAEGLSIAFDAGSGSTYYTASCNSWQTITVNINYFCNTAASGQLITQTAGATIEISAVRFYPATVDVSWVGLAGAQPPYTVYRYYAKTFPIGTVPAQNAGTSGAICATYSQMALLPVPGVEWTYPTQMRAVPSITLYNPSAANANWRDTTAGADVTATSNPDGLQNTLQNLIGAATAPASDNLCIQAVANASY